jgi:redox-sensitive bicupin YhaK (pirin superfamily)
MQGGASWTLPPARPGSNRTLYFFRGSQLTVNRTELSVGSSAGLMPDTAVELHNGAGQGEMLLLQGRPIREPVAHHGPFVMNTRRELEQAIDDYRSTGYGGWPWPSDGPVHPKNSGRFARHADGRVESFD